MGPGDEMEQILRLTERKGRIRRVLQGCAFLLSWPVVANLNLDLQGRIVIGILVLQAMGGVRLCQELIAKRQ